MFSAACVTLAAAAHEVMEHRGVPAWAYIVGLAVVFTFSRSAATRECGLPMISGLMLGAQAGLHLLFEAAQQATAPRTGGHVVAGGMPGMAHGHAMTVAGVPGMAHLTGGMLLGHTVAALTQAGKPAPDHPAPVLALTKAAAANPDQAKPAKASAVVTTAKATSDSTARSLGIAGLVVGALGLLAGAYGLVVGRRRTADSASR